MAPLKIASTLLFAAVVLLSVSFIDAKITSVSGDVVIMGTNSVPLPENVYNEPTNGFHDASSPIVNGELQIGIFEEKTAVKPPNDITIAGGVKLSKNKFYDSFFFFFHQATPNVNAESATGKVFFDNALVGCTSSNGEFNDGAKDIETFPIFGLDLPNFYPTTTTPARGLEGGDFATTSTELSIQVTIVQPGDYARCFTETCPPAGCTCSATPNTACLAGTGAAQCFPSVASLVDFSSSCDEVTASSAKYTVAGCDGTNGCTIKPDGSICFDDDTKTYSLSISGSGGCGCQISAFDLTLSPCCKYATIVNDEGFVSSKGKCACLQG